MQQSTLHTYASVVQPISSDGQFYHYIYYIIIFRCHLLDAVHIVTLYLLRLVVIGMMKEGKKDIQQKRCHTNYKTCYLFNHISCTSRSSTLNAFALHCPLYLFFSFSMYFSIPLTILSIIYSFYFFCLFDYVSKFFNSERFSLIYLTYSTLTVLGRKQCLFLQ